MERPVKKNRYLPRYTVEDVDRHGNARVYLRRPGERKIRLREPVGTTAFMDEYHRHLGNGGASSQPPKAKKAISRAAVGTFRWLCTKYFSSVEFRQLDPMTQRTRRSILEAACQEPVERGQASPVYGDLQISRFDTRIVRVLRDRKVGEDGRTGAAAANNRLKAIRRVFAYGVEYHGLERNCGRDVSKLKLESEGYHSWTLEEITEFEKVHQVGTKARMALALLLYTGQRISDVAVMGRQHISAGWLSLRQHKNRYRHPVTVEFPVVAELQRIINASPTGDMTFLTTEYGKPFTTNGLGNKFRTWCDQAGLQHCSAHGLRKACAARLAELGCTSHEIMSITGHRSLNEVERYTAAARRRISAKAAVEKLAKGMEAAEKVSHRES